MHLPYSNYLCRAPDTAAVGTICNVFSYDAVSGRDRNLSPHRRRADALLVDPRLRVSINYYLRLTKVTIEAYMAVPKLTKSRFTPSV